MALYAVNVCNFREPFLPTRISEPVRDIVECLHDYRGFSSLQFCNRQVTIVADSLEEAVEKAKSVEVRRGS